MRTQRVLIDDRIELSKNWTDKGGIFIHHTDAKSTLQKLVDRGILVSPTVDLGGKYVPLQPKEDVLCCVIKGNDDIQIPSSKVLASSEQSPNS